MHAVAPPEDWYLPAVHASHRSSPVVAVIVPGSQGEAAVAPAAQAEPAGHVVQSLGPVAPMVSLYEPAAHSNAALAPSSQYEPAGQSMHAVLPSADWYLPAAHLVHVCFCGSGLTVPGAHGSGTAEPTGQKVPSGQTTHCSSELRKPLTLRTVWLACVPPGHGCGADEPSTHR